jgi:hypothetical protein
MSLKFFLPLLLAGSVLLAGCASSSHAPAAAGDRAFVFAEDTFAYPNELVWEYGFDEEGNWSSRRRDPPPTYSHHCFVVARAARQFFEHARFDPSRGKVAAEEYRELVRRVVRSNPRRRAGEEERIVIPGFANLREFSRAHEALLKAECGGAWQSYWQRGHWRMVAPFSRRHQVRMAEQLVRGLEQNRPPVVHLVCFPALSINHAVVLIGVEPTPRGLAFSVYDPNLPEHPSVMYFDRAAGGFELPPTSYFSGGKINVYEVYHSCLY